MSVREQCQKCYKYYHHTLDTTCPICRDISFAEHLLCELTREDQKALPEFECAAFRPNLMLVGSEALPYQEHAQDKETEIPHDIMQSAKVKWFLAFAKQQLEFHPDEVVYDIKFHLCLATKYRKPLFSGIERYFNNIAEVVQQSGDFFEGSVYFLGMGADHLHIYIDSTPDYAVEELVNNILPTIEKGFLDIISEVSSVREPFFNKVYFIETLGSGGHGF